MKRSVLGIVLILIGLLLLLEIFDVLVLPSFAELWSYWPFLLIALGLFFLVRGDTSFISFFLVFLGIIFSLKRYAMYPFTLESVLFPSLIVALGVSFVLSGMFAGSQTSSHYHKDPRKPPRGMTRNMRSVDIVDESVFLSGKEFTVHSEDFKGGELSVFLGGMEVDLRNVKLMESATLYLRCTLGGLEVYLPSEVRIRVSGREILGGADVRVHQDGSIQEGPILLIDYQVTLGGIDIIQ